MSALELFFLIGGLASILAIPLSIVLARRQGPRQKLLAYRADRSPFPLVSSRSLREYSLSVVFQPEGAPEERVDDTFVHFLTFANFGREPIRREDIAPQRPLELQIEGARVLDVAVEAIRRSVSNIAIGPDLVVADDVTTVRVDFDFLDYQDGALVRVVTTSPPNRINFIGEIIGMPAGIAQADEVRRRPFLAKVGVGLAIVFELAALGSTPFIVRWATGDWGSVWLLAVPIVAIVLPIVISALIGATIWPKSGVTFPKELAPRIRGLPYPIYYRELGPGFVFEVGTESDPGASNEEPDVGSHRRG